MKDDTFLRGQRVPMTKEPLRLLALERLELAYASHFIDVGAGTGSVAIEAALRHPALAVTAIERNPDALALIAENGRRLACHNLEIISGTAPLTVEKPADAIFIGGSGGQLPALLAWSLAQLQPGGRLVMAFILLDNLNSALGWLAAQPVEALDCCQMSVSHYTTLGSGYYFKPANPTFLISCRKGVLA